MFGYNVYMLSLLYDLPLAFIPLFVAIDIFGVLPIFLSLTQGLTLEERSRIARESVVTALFVGLAFIAAGEVIFGILGITESDFKIAGGLVLLVFAVLDLVRGTEARKSARRQLGVVPIGVPLIVGPAVLTTLIVLVDHYGVPPAVIAFLLNLAIVWIFFRKGISLVKVLGQNGITAISKIMSLLLASIAVMMIRLGVENIISKQ
jgi:multiple antibiotic resistance protein